MQINPHDIHIWSTLLIGDAEAEQNDFALLSPDEQQRALRFHFPIHKQRFIFARALLRKILGLYLQVSPAEIIFNYNEQLKPSLAPAHASDLRFNVSHSDNRAVYAFTLEHEIGIDIEKITEEINLGIAERYFSPQENNELQLAHQTLRNKLFYRLWSRKEALIKGVGRGLHIPLASFSVSTTEDFEMLNYENQAWAIYSFPIDSNFAAALATTQKIQTISQWSYNEHAPTQEKLILF